MNLTSFSDDALHNARRIIIGSYAILRDHRRFTRGALAKDAHDQVVAPSHPDAERYCVLGVQAKVRLDLHLPRPTFWNQDPSEIADTCALEMYPRLRPAQRRPAAHANDRLGHEAALKILRCSMQKVRAELKRRKGN